MIVYIIKANDDPRSIPEYAQTVYLICDKNTSSERINEFKDSIDARLKIIRMPSFQKYPEIVEKIKPIIEKEFGKYTTILHPYLIKNLIKDMKKWGFDNEADLEPHRLIEITISFIDRKKYEDIIKKGQEEYSIKYLQGRKAWTDTDLMNFTIWFTFTKVVKEPDQTFADIVASSGKGLKPSERKAIIAFKDYIDGAFEIIHTDKQCYIGQDLLTKENYYILKPEVTRLPKLEIGSIIRCKIFPWKGFFVIYGPVMVVPAKDAEEYKQQIYDLVEKSTKPSKEERMAVHRDFIDYFGTDNVIFETSAELEDAVNRFIDWLTRKEVGDTRKHIDEEPPKRFIVPDNIRNKKGYGLISSMEYGTYVVPNYQELKTMFSIDNPKEYPNWKIILKEIIEDPEIPVEALRLAAEAKEDILEEMVKEIVSEKIDVSEEDLDSAIEKYRKQIKENE